MNAHSAQGTACDQRSGRPFAQVLRRVIAAGVLSADQLATAGPILMWHARQVEARLARRERWELRHGRLRRLLGSQRVRTIGNTNGRTLGAGVGLGRLAA